MNVKAGTKRLVIAVTGLALAGAVTVVEAGVAAASQTAAPARPAAHAAAAKTFVFPTTVAGLRVRARPTTASRTVRVLGPARTQVTVDCYVRGQSINGDPIWYHSLKPAVGYVAGYYLRSGRDPARGVPRCTR